MKRKYWILIAVLVMMLTLAGFASSAYDEPEYQTSNNEVANAEPAEAVLVYDEYIDLIVGCESVAQNTWMLYDGNYTAIFVDGSQCELSVDNGSWYITK